MNIYEKISEVMKDIEYLSKDDSIEYKSTKYRAISEEKVTSEVRKSLVKHGIVIIPIEQVHSNKELIRTDSSVNMLSTVDTKYRIQNIEDVNDFVIAVSGGTGVDTQDKGVGKAMTYSYKYLLLRTFAIPTGEDPDKISSKKTDGKIAKEKQEQAEKQAKELAEKVIDSKKIDVLKKTIEKYKVDDDSLFNIIQKYGYNIIEEIKNKDYVKIGNALSEHKTLVKSINEI
jgi:hypothetical protein